MSRQQADHFRAIKKRERKFIALRNRLKTLQKEWHETEPVFKKEITLNTRIYPPQEWIKEMWKKQNGRCMYCCIELSTVTIHIDHVIPKAKDGSNDFDNLALACAHCNIFKKDRDVIGFMLKMLTYFI